MRIIIVMLQRSHYFLYHYLYVKCIYLNGIIMTSFPGEYAKRRDFHTIPSYAFTRQFHTSLSYINFGISTSFLISIIASLDNFLLASSTFSPPLEEFPAFALHATLKSSTCREHT